MLLSIICSVKFFFHGAILYKTVNYFILMELCKGFPLSTTIFFLIYMKAVLFANFEAFLKIVAFIFISSEINMNDRLLLNIGINQVYNEI